MRDRRTAVQVFALISGAILSLLLMPASVPAQMMPMMPEPSSPQHVPLAELLPRLILGEITVQSPPAAPGNPAGLPVGFSHMAHFSPLLENDPTNPAVGIVQGFNGQMATQFSTFPLGSSTGGLTYVFDESVGTFRRSSTSFGPMFAERALTIGRRKLSLGLTYQHASYNTFEGQNLKDGSIKFYLRHEDCCTAVPSSQPPGITILLQPSGDNLNPFFKGDLIRAALSLKAKADTAAVIANYGLTDHWDVGLAVPFVRVSVDAQVRASILRLSTPTIPNLHAFDQTNPTADLTLSRTGNATGIGDTVLRTKYHFLRREEGGLAAGVDLRVPTGDKNELLGAGGVQGKFLLIASNERGRFGQHANIGYTVAGGRVAGTILGLNFEPVPDEINYSGGIEFVAGPRVTLIGDFVGRTLRGARHLDLVSNNFKYAVFTSVTPTPSAYGGSAGPDCGAVPGPIPGLTCRSIFLKEFTPRPGNLTLLLGTGGVKYNLTGNMLVAGSVLFPLTNAGLRSRVIAAVGVDYVF
jgi:Putative MetA-pathway of phenol degradation